MQVSICTYSYQFCACIYLYAQFGYWVLKIKPVFKNNCINCYPPNCSLPFFFLSLYAISYFLLMCRWIFMGSLVVKEVPLFFFTFFPCISSSILFLNLYYLLVVFFFPAGGLESVRRTAVIMPLYSSCKSTVECNCRPLILKGNQKFCSKNHP